jgi:hypothetical protein
MFVKLSLSTLRKVWGLSLWFGRQQTSIYIRYTNLACNSITTHTKITIWDVSTGLEYYWYIPFSEMLNSLHILISGSLWLFWHTMAYISHATLILVIAQHRGYGTDATHLCRYSPLNTQSISPGIVILVQSVGSRNMNSALVRGTACTT